MDQLSILRKVVNAGKLLRVEEIILGSDSPRFIAGIALRFERQSLHVIAQAEDDSLIVGFTLSPNPEHMRFPVTDRPPWSLVCGRRCFAAWLMTNQQGYTDGLRLQFSPQPVATFVEFVVAASEIHCCQFQADF